MQTDPLKNIELIEAWYEGRLNDSERAHVTALLDTDAAFKEEFELYHILLKGIKHQNEAQIKAELNKIDSDLDCLTGLDQKFSHNRSFFGIPYAIAATILFVVFSGAAYFYYTQFSKQGKLNTYLIEDPGLPVYMSSTSQKDLDEAMNHYKLQDYQKSLQLFEGLLLQDPENDTLLYFAGINLLKLKEPDAASVFFKHVSDSPNSEFYEKALYRYAVCLWHEGRNEEANTVLDQMKMVNAESEYCESLAKLLN